MAYSSARALDANEFRRTAVTPTAMEIMTTSIQYWKTVLNAIVWRVTRRISCCSHTVRKFRRLIFIAPERRLPRGNWR